MDNLEQDYRPIAELDEYEAEGVDDEDYDEMDPEARRQADEVVRQRHLEQLALNQRIPQALLEDETSSMSMGGFREERRNAQRMMIEEDEGDDDEIENDDKFLDANESRGRLTQWINEPRTQRFITRTFKNFLRKFPRGSSNALYIRKIEKMYSHNKQSLEVDYQHLMEYLRNPTLGLWLLEQPALILPHLHSVARKVVLEHNPEYNKIHSDVYVRITGLPYEERLRDLRRLHLNQLVQIRGVITRRYPVYSQLKKIYYI
jgi:DNA replication licensing factor MCM2